MNLHHCLILLVALAIAPYRIQAAEPSKVVVSIAPLHSLIAGLTKGITTPELLVKGGVSPHGFSLRPSHMRAISEADVIFWLGAEAEAFLERPLANARPVQRVFNLMQSPGLTLLDSRTGDHWPTEPQDAGHEGHEHAHDGRGIDPHIWLNPLNAETLVKAATIVLMEADPERAAQYRENSDRLLFRLQNLDLELQDAVTMALGKPYLVFHDAYQYFEQRYGLNAVGAISVSPERRPGARRLQEIRQLLKETKAHCIFTEPQFPATYLKVITEGGDYYSGTLDPLGIDIPAGPDLYFILMRRLTSALVACLCQVYVGSELPALQPAGNTP
jgi:zinc transport system substrate-binding protein